MFESETSLENYKTLEISVGIIIENPEMLKFVPDHLKTKKVCKNAGKELEFVIYVPGRCKAQ